MEPSYRIWKSGRELANRNRKAPAIGASAGSTNSLEFDLFNVEAGYSVEAGKQNIVFQLFCDVRISC